MKKLILAVFLLVLISLPALAQSIEVEKTEVTPVIIVELANPIEYTLEITNNGPADTFEIYSLAGFEITPQEVEIGEDETKTVNLKAYASDNRLRTTRGEFVFDYRIKSPSDEITDQLGVKMIELEDLFKARVNDITPQEDNVTITIDNRERISLKDVSVHIDSPFFEGDKIFTLGPYGKTVFSIPLDEAQKDKLVAGSYIADFDFELEGNDASLEAQFNYLEKEGLALSESTEGFIVRERRIERTNTGNTPLTATTTAKLDRISRLFTTFSEKPISSENSGFFVIYNWEKELSPSESLDVVIKTNYTFPFIIILLIIIITASVKIFLEGHLKVRKHVSMIRTKGDEFALRVRLNVKAKREVSNVHLVDRIPSMTKLYDKFGIRPDQIDEKTRRLIWEIKHLNAGEERVFSYIIYSKIKVVGKLELPQASASYDKDGKKMHVYSNTTSIATETTEGLPKYS